MRPIWERRVDLLGVETQIRITYGYVHYSHALFGCVQFRAKRQDVFVNSRHDGSIFDIEILIADSCLMRQSFSQIDTRCIRHKSNSDPTQSPT